MWGLCWWISMEAGCMIVGFLDIMCHSFYVGWKSCTIGMLVAEWPDEVVPILDTNCTTALGLDTRMATVATGGVVVIHSGWVIIGLLLVIGITRNHVNFVRWYLECAIGLIGGAAMGLVVNIVLNAMGKIMLPFNHILMTILFIIAKSLLVAHVFLYYRAVPPPGD